MPKMRLYDDGEGAEMTKTLEELFSGIYGINKNKQTYLASYKCKNCGCESNKEIPKGTLAPDVLLCKKCDCLTAVKVAR